MKKILFCWELGEDYGHLGTIKVLAHQFANKPIQLYVACKDLPSASKIEWPANVKFIQAPIWLRNNPLSLKASSFAEILLYKGYGFYRDLKMLVDAWLAIIELTTPDVILFDYAPTALLAASGLNRPKIIISNPYLTPAPGTSTISLIPNNHFDETRAKEIHQQVVRNINAVRQDYSVPPITAIGDLFLADATYLSGFKETDYFGAHRSNAIYCGAALATSIGVQEPHWKPGLSSKFLAYLKHRDPRSKVILTILANMQARVLCFYSDGKPDDIEEFSNSSLTVSNIPFDLTHAYDQVSAIICHGGQGIVNEALTRGKPLILVPMQTEQYYLAEKVVGMGIGISITKSDSASNIEDKLIKFFSNPAFSEKAKRLAQNNLTIDQQQSIQQMVTAIEQHLPGTGHYQDNYML